MDNLEYNTLKLNIKEELKEMLFKSVDLDKIIEFINEKIIEVKNLSEELGTKNCTYALNSQIEIQKYFQSFNQKEEIVTREFLLSQFKFEYLLLNYLQKQSLTLNFIDIILKQLDKFLDSIYEYYYVHQVLKTIYDFRVTQMIKKS